MDNETKTIRLIVIGLLFVVVFFLLYGKDATSEETVPIPSATPNFIDFGIPQDVYDSLFEDDIISDDERRYLYETYYELLPEIFLASATWYGADGNAYGEILKYGEWLRQQMWRGWVLIGSGQYGYHDDFDGDPLLSKQASPLYYHFADRYVDLRGQPIQITYEKLNTCQRRIYDLTEYDIREKVHREAYFMAIEEQSKLTPESALLTGKYIAIVSAKSVNDFGRRFMLFIGDMTNFVGVVVVGGEAKRDDWTGLGSPTNDTFKFNYFPLSTRTAGKYHWAFDFPTSVYEYFGGDGGHVSGIIAVDPDPIDCSLELE